MADLHPTELGCVFQEGRHGIMSIGTLERNIRRLRKVLYVLERARAGVIESRKRHEHGKAAAPATSTSTTSPQVPTPQASPLPSPIPAPFLAPDGSPLYLSPLKVCLDPRNPSENLVDCWVLTPMPGRFLPSAK